MRCKTCSTVIPHRAKFCPKCGGRAEGEPGGGPPLAAGALPSKAPIPPVGKLFIASALLGVALLAAGLVGGIPVIFYIGVGLMAVVLLAALVGHHVS
jgi:hypothetical protein